MNHSIPKNAAGPWTLPMQEAIQACVHCGFCLPACPTYQEMGQEMDTPRGRILMMKKVLEGELPLASALPHVDRCLGCLACETACPSGVHYRDLISPFRQLAATQRSFSTSEKIKRWALLNTLPHPDRFRLAARTGALAKRVNFLVPKAFRPMLDLLPTHLPAAAPLKEHYPASGQAKGRVALLAGCAQQVLSPEINHSTIAVLNRCGIEVFVPRAQACCGALAWHVGAGDAARTTARKNLVAFPPDIDAIITNAAGCGSGLHEYPLMFQGMPEAPRASDFAAKVVDICSYLSGLEIPAIPSPGKPLVVAYHDACHLSHAQGVRSAPRDLLQRIPGLELREIRDADICCGSAGTYNIDQPQIAASLGRKKAENILATGADWLVAGNIGCLTQIQTHLRRAARPIRILHTVELLEMAWTGKLK